MPSAYAHIRFGRELLERLPPALSARIRPEYKLFELGLIGPDFLFFYRPFVPNRVIPRGRRIHAQAGLCFFMNGARAYRKSGFSDKHFAYLCGAVCHFALDRACHGYISAFTERFNVGHFELEDSFDRALLRYDGLDPGQCALGRLRADKEQSAVIADFYGNISPAKIRGAVRYAAYLGTLYHDLRTVAGRGVCAALCGSECRRRKSAMKKGRIGLMKRYRDSLRTAARLVGEIDGCARGEKGWDKAYAFNFAGERVMR